MHLKVSKKYLAAKCSIMHRQYEYIPMQKFSMPKINRLRADCTNTS